MTKRATTQRSSVDHVRGSIARNLCGWCGSRINIMIRRGTGVCCGDCEKKLKDQS